LQRSVAPARTDGTSAYGRRSKGISKGDFHV
jgi:hypothetical protein